MKYKITSCLLVLALLAAWPAAAQKAGDNGSNPWARAGQEKSPVFDPQAREILLNMCGFMKSQKDFSFKAEVTNDRLSDKGEPVQYSFDLEVDVRRPDGLRIRGQGDEANKEFVYDGKTYTLYDKTHNVYASEEAPDDIEGALDAAQSRHDLTVSLADMAGAKLCEHISKGIRNGRYEGLHNVHGVPAHHFSFDRGNDRFQLWVSTGDRPVLEKVVITRGGLPYAPQWTAYLTDWNFEPQFKDSLFAFVPPRGAEKIDFAPLQTPMAPETSPGMRKGKGGKT
jgi:hypothetical protein